jgi:hypothetical protein
MSKRYLKLNFLECQGLIHGCAQCQKATLASTFLECTKCIDGYYLLQNQTLNDDIPSTFSFCVSDCAQAHQAWVNNPITGKCQECGYHCGSCNLKYGCESCQANAAGKPWVNLDSSLKLDGSNSFLQCTCNFEFLWTFRMHWREVLSQLLCHQCHDLQFMQILRVITASLCRSSLPQLFR